MFKRNPRSYLRIVAEFFYPRGGWYRAARYVIHRVRRLPDPAHRISRGIAAGVFTCFTPLFGLHFVIAATLAWIMRGNILAALLATFVGNPVTFPLIAELSLSLGNTMLGSPQSIHLPAVMAAFGGATSDIGSNFFAIFTGADWDWSQFNYFYHRVFLPYLVGGIAPGVLAGLVGYFLSNPLIHAYQRRRIKKLKARYEKRLAERISRAGDKDEIR
ncbi:hypothetical protein XMM379_000905 [Aliiroseovarius sp. xm-m-379]|uniref:DUF2062 domain-containing protein n=1 Tax=unclassified Aliiroseovarius TaxID=2623558 RepID=UPI00156A38CF|nr:MULTISPECIES: DUF2062 domain-containing protein [unclassified Aliiroseovarius]NRP12941.1 hypothetical protein [Aliiroseovarius sp. xm-d-517]NRP24225.1 hypothetical protein [Aliiroseovarius sp. xm-m-379]NRP29963.1 hypothetical protein [Aliiroseovarius sp. xm-m-314]NRP33024.1 hypothetical protein [Aliiroseovarius sp. xm-a-104]NRP39974.1 hypothetical protein [Aliiroseovarius sp. xm-m-339-2]